MNMASEDSRMSHEEFGPGWCSLCQVDCRTQAVLVSHSMGKRHKKQIERQITEHEGLPQTDSCHPREELKNGVAIEQMCQEIPMSKGPTLAGSTDGTEAAEVSQKELNCTTTSRESDFKEQLKCELCNMNFLSRKCLDGHLVGKRHAAEVASAGAHAETDLDMLTDSGKKRCRADFEGEMRFQCSLAASNVAGQGEEKSNQVLFSDKTISNGHNEGKQGGHLDPSSLATHIANVPAAGQDAGFQQQKEIRCELCNIECDSEISLQAHVAGKKHAVRLKRSLAIDGAQCLNANEAEYLDAENGGDKKKRKKRSRGEIESKKVSDCIQTASDCQDGGFVAVKAGIKEDRQISCDICNIKCSSKKEFEWHILGKKHAAHLKKLPAGSVPAASVGITGMASEQCDKVLGKEVSLQAASWNGADFTHAVKHVSEGKVLGGPGDAVLVGDNKITLNDETGCDLCNILCRKIDVLEEDNAIVSKHVDRLEMLPTKGSSAFATKTRAVNGEKFDCAGAETSPILETMPEAEIKQEKEQIFSGLCGKDCVKNTQSNIIFKVHANCLLKLLTMDAKTCRSAVEAMFRETQIAREREAISRQLVSLWEEGIQSEEPECNVCHIKCGSKKDLDGHLAGKKHAIQLKKLRGTCELCDIYCGSKKALKAHLAGRKHAAKVRLIIGEKGGVHANDSSFPPRHENNRISEDVLKVMAGSIQLGVDGSAGDVLKIAEESKRIGQTDETDLKESHRGDGKPGNMLRRPVESAQQTGQIVIMSGNEVDGSPEDMLRIAEESTQEGPERCLQTGRAGEIFVTKTLQGNGNANAPKVCEESTHTEKIGHPVLGDKNVEDVLKIPEVPTQTGDALEAP